MKDYKETLENNISIIEYYGVKKQIPIWIEEMSELTKELCKWLRKYDLLNGECTWDMADNLKEEITDVTVCLDQLKYALKYTEDELMEQYEYKVNRQLQRIQGENQ